MSFAHEDMDSEQPLKGFVKLCRVSSMLRDELALTHELIRSEDHLAGYLNNHFDSFESFKRRLDLWVLHSWIELVDTYKEWLNEPEKRLRWLEHVRVAKSTAEWVLNKHSNDEQLKPLLQGLRSRWDRVNCVELFLREVCCFYDRNNIQHYLKPIRLWNVSLVYFTDNIKRRYKY